MQPVVLEEPYEFVPPYHGRFWPWLLQKLVPWHLRRHFGIQDIQVEGLERLAESLAAGNSVLLAPNHCRPSDPSVVAEVCRRAGVRPFTMASWHVFKQGWLQRFVLHRIGGFSVYREGTDRQALQAGIEILQNSRRPLVIFPEGVITRTNDRILALMEGVSFMARAAAKKRAASDAGGKVVVHPVAIRYHFDGDIDAVLHETLDEIETRLSWRPKRDPDRVQRILRVGEALLWLKEIEYFGQPQLGDIPARLQRLIDRILEPIEEEWLNGKTEKTAVGRVKKLRIAILPELITGEVSEQERKRRWDQLADMYLAQQLSHYAPDDMQGNPTPERLLETVEKFEEDLTDHSRIHQPMTVTVNIGTAITVSPRRERGVSEDPLMTEIERQLHEMLGISRPESCVDPANLDAVEVGPINERS